VSGQWVPKHRTGYRKGPTTICCKPVRWYHQLMAGSGTKMSRGSVEHNTHLDTGEQNRIQTWACDDTEFVLDTLGYVKPVWSSKCISCLRPRSNFVYHWLHELPSSTLAATYCIFGAHRRQRYSSQRGTSRRRAQRRGRLRGQWALYVP